MGDLLSKSGLFENRADVATAQVRRRPVVLSTPNGASADSYTVLIGPGYWDTKESMVNSVIPSTVACATKTRSKGSL